MRHVLEPDVKERLHDSCALLRLRVAHPHRVGVGVLARLKTELSQRVLLPLGGRVREELVLQVFHDPVEQIQSHPAYLAVNDVEREAEAAGLIGGQRAYARMLGAPEVGVDDLDPVEDPLGLGQLLHHDQHGCAVFAARAVEQDEVEVAQVRLPLPKLAHNPRVRPLRLFGVVPAHVGEAIGPALLPESVVFDRGAVAFARLFVRCRRAYRGEDRAALRRVALLARLLLRRRTSGMSMYLREQGGLRFGLRLRLRLGFRFGLWLEALGEEVCEVHPGPPSCLNAPAGCTHWAGETRMSSVYRSDWLIRA